MCELLGVSRAGFYRARQRRPSARARATARLRVAVRAEHAASAERYGAVKIYHELREQGIPCGRHGVARVMREEGLRGCRPRRVSGDDHAVGASRAGRAERAGPPVRPVRVRERDRAWVADITYLSTAEGWLYLAVVLDIGTRRVVGWNAAPHLASRSRSVR